MAQPSTSEPPMTTLQARRERLAKQTIPRIRKMINRLNESAEGARAFLTRTQPEVSGRLQSGGFQKAAEQFEKKVDEAIDCTKELMEFTGAFHLFAVLGEPLLDFNMTPSMIEVKDVHLPNVRRALALAKAANGAAAERANQLEEKGMDMLRELLDLTSADEGLRRQREEGEATRRLEQEAADDALRSKQQAAEEARRVAYDANTRAARAPQDAKAAERRARAQASRRARSETAASPDQSM